MVEYNAGDAKLRIVPDASNFKKDLEAKLKAISVDYTVKVNADLTQARADMERFRSQEMTKSIAQRIDPQLTRAREEMARFRAEQRANAINIPVKVDTDVLGAAAKGAITGAGAKAGQTFGKAFSQGFSQIISSALSAGMTVGITALIANIPAAVTAVTSLTSAIQQLSGAALVVPGAIGSAVASIGTLAVGLSGITDLYGAMTAVSEESGASIASRASAATSATNSLRNAVVDEADAQKDVARARRDARRELEDLNVELRGGQIDEAQAINDLNKAQRDLAKGGFKDQYEYIDAVLRRDQAQQRVIESQTRQNRLQDDANEKFAKGIEGSDEVVAANERATRATQARVAAQDSLTQATAATGSAQEKLDAEMAKHAPQMQEFVRTLIGLKPRWEELKKSVEGNLFEGMSVSFTQFVDNILPTLQGGMESIATAWNSNIKTLMDSLGSERGKGILDRILGNTAEAQRRLNNLIDPLVRGFGTLTAAGSDAMPRIVDALAGAAERFANFIEQADQDGRLQGWIDAGLKGFGDLMEILLNIGKAFTSIHDALGGDLLGSLRSFTEKWATWLASTEGQNKLKAFFEEGRREIEELKPIIENIIQLIPAIWRGFKEAWDLMYPPLKLVTDLLVQHPDLIIAVVTAFTAWKTITAVGELATALKAINAAFDLMPTKATEAGTKSAAAMAPLTKALGPIAALLAVGEFGPDIQKWIEEHIPGADWLDSLPNVGDAGKALRDKWDEFYEENFGEGATTPVPATGGSGSREPEGGASPPPPGQPPPLPPPPDLKEQLRQRVRDGKMPGYYLAPDNKTILGPDGRAIDIEKLVPGQEAGGPTKAGLAMLHDGEFVLSNRANKYPDSFKQALNEGRIDPRLIPHFQEGGLFDFASIAKGIMPGGVAPGPIGGTADVAGAVQPDFLHRWFKWLPPEGQPLDPAQIYANMPDKIKPGNIAAQFGTELYKGVLGFFGLENSMLSPGNEWTRAITGTANYYMGEFGGSGSTYGTDPYAGTQTPTYGQVTSHGTTVPASSYAGTQTGYTGPATPAYTGSTGTRKYIGAVEKWRPTVIKALSEIGPKYGITNIGGWADAILGQIQFESKGDPGALNPRDSDGLPAIGLGQFKSATFASHNITGGSINDGTAQIYAMIDYVAKRYGQNSSGIPNYINQGHGYDSGGWLPTGVSLAVNNTGHPEYIVPSFAIGGAVEQFIKTGVVMPKPPPPRPPDAQTKITPPPAPSPAPPPITTPGPAPTPGPGAPTPAPHIGTGAAPGPIQQQPASGTGPVQQQPIGDTGSHLLPAVSTGIRSGAEAIGNIAASAVNAAQAAGTFGAGAGGGGGAGEFVKGLVVQGGKIVEGAANVGASFLVGTVGGIGGSTGNAYGQTYHPAQQQPATAGNKYTTNYNGGIVVADPHEMRRELDLRDAQHFQSQLAHH